MKRALALVSVITLTAVADISVKEIDRLVNDIKKEREGLTEAQIAAAKDPFVYFTTRKRAVIGPSAPGIRPSRKHRFILTAIINERVKINGKWYSLHQKVHGYTIEKVGPDYVVLRHKQTRVKVFMYKTKHKSIKINMR